MHNGKAFRCCVLQQRNRHVQQYSERRIFRLVRILRSAVSGDPRLPLPQVSPLPAGKWRVTNDSRRPGPYRRIIINPPGRFRINPLIVRRRRSRLLQLSVTFARHENVPHYGPNVRVPLERRCLFVTNASLECPPLFGARG